MACGLTWNSSSSTLSMSRFLRRAERSASSISSADSTALATSASYLPRTVACGFWRCLKAIASVSHRLTMPSSASGENGWPLRVLIAWTTPISSLEPASTTGATSICLVR